MNIDTNELKRILKIKSEYDRGLIDIDMIMPEDYKVIKVLYDYEINDKKDEIKKLKSEIGQLYTNIEKLIDQMNSKK